MPCAALSGSPEHPCPALRGSSPVHLAEGTRAPLYARVAREGGDALDGGVQAGAQTDGDPDKALF